MTRAQRKKISIGMKAAFARKKKGKDQKKFDFEPVSNMTIPTPPFNLEQEQEDLKRNAEYQFRRGLVTAMECILRELR